MAVVFPFFRIKCEITLQNIINGVTVILGLERCDFFYKLKYHNAQGPQVNLLIVASAGKHLRSPIKWCSCQREHIFVDTSLIKFGADSKID